MNSNTVPRKITPTPTNSYKEIHSGRRQKIQVRLKAIQANSVRGGRNESRPSGDVAPDGQPLPAEWHSLIVQSTVECAVWNKTRRLRIWVFLLAVAVLGVAGWWSLNDALRLESAGNESRVGDTSNFESTRQRLHQLAVSADADWAAAAIVLNR